MTVLAAVATLCFWAGTTPARAGLVTELTVSPTQAPNGLFTYAFTLADESNSTISASQLFLAVSPRADLSGISAPAGWDVFYSAGASDISFLSSDPLYDIAPGTVGMFSLSSRIGPALGSDLVRGFDDSAGTFAENKGTVLTASVPEPTGLALGLLGTACAAAFLATRGRPAV
jgi:hypothetical protein